MSHVFKCKICGGQLDISAHETVCTCEYCGTTQTIPLLDSEKKIRLFNRANEYRLENEFDKAYSAYEAIILEEPDEAEAYWGLVLSDYGVEYVEDPKTGKRTPTLHRTKIQSVLNSPNYRSALEHADAERRMIYQDEAETIDKLQRRILAVSSREEPYDIFISYKETDENGERTRDSVIAQDIYDQLEKEGFRTFLSRVSLKDHIGENYEPYIYAALNSAKIMLLVTTKSEYCDSVWVRNEWSRFLKLREEDLSKIIIPVYRDMTPYELPAELQSYQSQDIGKVGSMQDLVSGIKRILGRTDAQIKNAELETLLEKDRKKEAASVKRKTIRNRIIAGVLAVVLGIFAYNKVLDVIYRLKTTIVTDGQLPDPAQYNSFTVTITEQNYDDFFEWKQDGQILFLHSKVFDDGWYYYKTVESDEWSANIACSNGMTTGYTYREFTLPVLWDLKNNQVTPGAIPSFEKPFKAEMMFVYKDLVKEYTINESGFRLIRLKNGDEQDRFYLDWNITGMDEYPY